jgi:hypothetical protein
MEKVMAETTNKSFAARFFFIALKYRMTRRVSERVSNR